MTRILPAPLRSWAARALDTAGASQEDATQIAEYLVDVDLRGIVSHGTRQLRRYVGEFREGQINPTPTRRILKETDSSIRFDGDGGAGYPVAALAVDAACTKAGHTGLALASTCHHGHVGSAGIYARRAAAAGLISWCVAGGRGWKRPTQPDATVWDSMAAPPMCFGVPADGDGPPLILDMNANQFGTRERAEAALEAGFGKAVFGSLGMRFVSTLLAGCLSGALDEETTGEWSKATRGFFFVVIDPALVGPADSFRARVREVIDQSLSLQPMAGTDSAALPGTLEWQRERTWVTEGIPIPDEHRQLLEAIAADLQLDPPGWMS